MWKHNLRQEIWNLCAYATSYPCVAVEARVPECIVELTGPFSSCFQYNYSVLRANVEMHHALSITLAVSDQYGRRPQGVSAWRFNFQIGPSTFVDEDLLKKAFNAPQLRKDLHRRQGISSQAWGEEALGTCLVREDATQYVLFTSEQGLGESPNGTGLGHGRFAGLYALSYYLLPKLTSQGLPAEPAEMLKELNLYVPSPNVEGVEPLLSQPVQPRQTATNASAAVSPKPVR